MSNPKQVDGTLQPLTKTKRRRPIVSARFMVVLLVTVSAVVIFVRLWQLTSHPALEWDEPVYRSIASNLTHNGVLAMKSPIGSEGTYLYQPPFYFGILSLWFGIVGDSLGAARVLAAGASFVTLGLLYAMLRANPGGAGALVILGILAIDGWLVFSSRIALIEHLMLPIAILGLLVYRWAYESDMPNSRRLMGFVLAGSMLGAAAVFKHTGAYVLLVLPINWLLLRKYGQYHLVALAAAATVIVGYLVGMSSVFGLEFWEQYRVQFSRALGLVDSRGSVGGLDVLRALLSNYVVFLGTIVAVSVSLVLVVIKLLRAVRDRSLDVLRDSSSLYLAWTLAALISFGFLGLRLPQYSMLVLIPLYMYAGTEAVQFIREDRSWNRRWTAALVALLMTIAAMSSAAFVARIVLTDDNAILQAAEFVSSRYSPDVLVLTEEPIGVLIPQPYMSLDLWAIGVDQMRPDVIVIYTSLTQAAPASIDLDKLLAISKPVANFSGFKETITVYELP